MNERVRGYLKEAEALFTATFGFVYSPTNIQDRLTLVEIAKMVQLDRRQAKREKKAQEGEEPKVSTRRDPIEEARRSPRPPLFPQRITPAKKKKPSTVRHPKKKAAKRSAKRPGSCRRMRVYG